MKHTGDLKGTPHAQAGQSMGRQPGDIAPFKQDVTLIGFEQSSEGVEKSAFASAVGANDGVELARLDLHVHVLQSLQAPKSFGDSFHFQHQVGVAGTHASPFLNRPTKPDGMSKTNNTMMMPMNKGQYSVLPLIITSSTTYTAAPTAGP